MQMTTLTFLGTGTSQGVPVIGCDCKVCTSHDPRDRRLRTSALVECRGVRLQIDAGPDFRYQMLREGIARIDAILLTHEHKDHTGGLDDVRPFNYFSRKPMEIYAAPRVLERIRRDFDYAFADDPYPGVPEINLHPVEAAEPFSVQGVEVVPVQGSHYTFPVLGYRIGGLAYLTDFKEIAPAEAEKLRGVDTLVVNALRRELHYSHFNLDEAVALSRAVGARRTYLTHVSHQMGLCADVERLLPEGVMLAFDGMKIETER